MKTGNTFKESMVYSLIAIAIPLLIASVIGGWKVVLMMLFLQCGLFPKLVGYLWEDCSDMVTGISFATVTLIFCVILIFVDYVCISKINKSIYLRIPVLILFYGTLLCVSYMLMNLM